MSTDGQRMVAAFFFFLFFPLLESFCVKEPEETNTLTHDGTGGEEIATALLSFSQWEGKRNINLLRWISWLSVPSLLCLSFALRFKSSYFIDEIYRQDESSCVCCVCSCVGKEERHEE